MTDTANCRELAELYRGLFRKIYEDSFEAYARTPVTVSSRPYVERILRLAQAGLTAAEEMARGCGDEGPQSFNSVREPQS